MSLTLADGSVLVLDSLQEGVIARQNGTDITLKEGKLSYGSSQSTGEETTYNTMSTPKGRQFKVSLPDGTQAWLNAASSIRYPTAFKGNERKVEIQGEVFFEVARNASMPFIVNVDNRSEVKVLGTSFNVNAYENENSINTTLIEGSVQVMTKQQQKILRPGQRAEINSKTGLRVFDNTDIDKVIAWKNGYFNFNDADLYEVMRQLERWYDIKVVYEKNIKPVLFQGELQRKLSLSQILDAFKSMNVKFTLTDDKQLIIGQ
ncbi:MAG: FecR domain-containing protein [Chitinophagaceae bacterium]|nr:FecR domain-containing protein [Chitinophagaceae bacterium]